MPAVTSPNLGLILNTPLIDIPSQGLQDGLNFRVKNGSIDTRNMGWEKFATWVLNGSVALIDRLYKRNGQRFLIFGTSTDLYTGDDTTIRYITPIYATGTASRAGAAVTGVGTAWVANAVAGDQISFGSATQTSLSATWYTIQSVNTDTSITLVGAPAGSDVVGPYTIRKLLHGATFTEYSTDTFINDGTSLDDLWFGTNGVDYVVTWNGTDTAATYHPELGFTCKVLRVYSNMMVYGNIAQGGQLLPTTIINSDLGLPLNAGAVGTGLSEQFVVHSGVDPIIAMVPIGDYLSIYSEMHLTPAQFVGDPLIFNFRVAMPGVGPISARGIADFGDYHEFIAADRAYVFDGATLKESNNHVWREILRQADPARRRQIYQHFDEENGDLIWSVPATTDADVGTSGGAPEIAWTEHYLEIPANPRFTGLPYSKRSFPFTATGYYERSSGLRWQDVMTAWQDFNFAWNDQFFAAAFPTNLGGDANGQIWTINQTQSIDGDPLPSYVRTGRFTASAGRNRDLLTRVYPFARQLVNNLEVKLYMGDSISGNVSDKGTQNFNMLQPEGGHFVTFYRRGRVAELQFGSDAGEPWILQGWDYDFVGGGRR